MVAFRAFTVEVAQNLGGIELNACYLVAVRAVGKRFACAVNASSQTDFGGRFSTVGTNAGKAVVEVEVGVKRAVAVVVLVVDNEGHEVFIGWHHVLTVSKENLNRLLTAQRVDEVGKVTTLQVHPFTSFILVFVVGLDRGRVFLGHDTPTHYPLYQRAVDMPSSLGVSWGVGFCRSCGVVGYAVRRGRVKDYQPKRSPHRAKETARTRSLRDTHLQHLQKRLFSSHSGVSSDLKKRARGSEQTGTKTYHDRVG